MKRIILLTIAALLLCMTAQAVDLTRTTIVYHGADAPLVKQMAQVLADDIERVSGMRPPISTRKVNSPCITIGTVKQTGRHRELRDSWERFAIDTQDGNIYVTGSDARGLAYGVLHISEAIGVSPWYWFADVPVDKTNKHVYDYTENYVSLSPSVKYRGIFINDEDWGLKTWAAQNYEKELGDIGPKTYDRVCELILRLKGNMLAPAMHSCTGAFYSHPKSQQVADKWGIMITTSHCEPLLFNNAALSEWDKERDGEWNYETNSETILKKLDDRIRETAQYDNIYTMGMRGLHDEAMKGSTDPKDRARTLEKVFAKQREILEKYKRKKATQLPQIFVPYKETLDIYDAGLCVPEDITLVWPDDNYGYMKRVSNAAEQQRSGHSGVYYHISYLGTPHDNLWIATTAPMLMYEELKKAYDAGADRYWLLNVGDIKPMEIEMQQFFDMAWNFDSFSYDNANRYQAEWLARTFSLNSQLSTLNFILDNYYRLAWNRKPEFMGYEMEWDNNENNRLHDTDFSFEDGTAQKRLIDYENICEAYGNSDPRITFSIKACEKLDTVIPKPVLETLIDDLEQVPQGVVKMSEVMPGTVETSNNVGRIVMEENHIFVSTHTRSFIDEDMEALSKAIAKTFTDSGAHSEVVMSAPAWQEDQQSPFLQLVSNTFQDVLGWRPRMVAMHFVLEAGFFVQHYPGIQIASIGPRIVEPHSTSERVELSTIGDIWQVLLELLKRLS